MFDRFRSLSTRQQIALVAACIAVLWGIIGAVWYGFLRVPYRVLFTDLRPTDAAAIIADLDRKKVSYRLTDGGATILVPADVADRTRLDAMTEDVPLKGTVGFELFDKSDMGLTDFAQRINYQRALQGELERTIQTLDGVDSARVHLSLGEDHVFRDDQVPPKASVTIRMQKGAVLSMGVAQGVQRLVAAAVPDLDVANVVILDEKGRVVSAQAGAQGDSTAVPPAEQERHAIEQYYQARTRLALERSYPLGGMAVSISAAIDDRSTAETASPDWSPAARSFPLAVTISSPNALDASTRDAVRSLVVTAVGYDAAKNDSIVFRVSVPETKARPAARAHVGRTRDMSAELPTSGMGSAQFAAMVALFLALVGSLCGFVWLALRPRRLSEVRRAQLVAKFRDLLDQEQRDAVT